MDAIRMPFQTVIDIGRKLNELDGGGYLLHSTQTMIKDEHHWKKGEYEFCLRVMLTECVISRVYFEHQRKGVMTGMLGLLKQLMPPIGITHITVQSVISEAMASWCVKNGFKPVEYATFDCGTFIAGDYKLKIAEQSDTTMYFTIQSREFLNTLIRGNTWHADPAYARETGTLWERDKDREAVGGAEPTYIYEPYMYYRDKKDPLRSDLETMRCEMSTDWDRLYGRCFCVLQLPRFLPVSTAHNSSPFVKIVSGVEPCSLLVAYEIVPFDNFWEQGFVPIYVKDRETHKLLVAKGLTLTEPVR